MFFIVSLFVPVREKNIVIVHSTSLFRVIGCWNQIDMMRLWISLELMIEILALKKLYNLNSV